MFYCCLFPSRRRCVNLLFFYCIPVEFPACFCSPELCVESVTTRFYSILYLLILLFFIFCFLVHVFLFVLFILYFLLFVYLILYIIICFHALAIFFDM